MCSSITVSISVRYSVAGNAGEEAGIGVHRSPSGENPGGEPSPAAGERRPHRDPIQAGERACGCCSKVLHLLARSIETTSQPEALLLFGFFLKATFYIQSAQSLLSELKIKALCTLFKTCKHGDEIRPIINLERPQQR